MNQINRDMLGMATVAICRILVVYVGPEIAIERARNIAQALQGPADEYDIACMLRDHIPFGDDVVRIVLDIRSAWQVCTSPTRNAARIRLRRGGMLAEEVERTINRYAA